MPGSDQPVLSIVIVIVSDTTHGRADVSHLNRTLASLERQADAPPMEVIVPHYPGVEGLDGCRRRFPHVRFVAINDLRRYSGGGRSREHHDELRARGLALARSEIVAMLEDHGVPDPKWSAVVVAAHRQNFAAIGGPIDNEVDRPLNWAVYFCDFGRYQSPMPEGETEFASDANVSYKRAALESIRPVWQDVFREPEVNGALQTLGHKLGIAPAMLVWQHRDLELSDAVAERFVWGRSYGAIRGGSSGFSERILLAAASPLLPALMLQRMFAGALRKRRCLGAFLKALPLTAVLSASWACGEMAGYLAGLRQPVAVEPLERRPERGEAVHPRR